jgi:uncharacterized protein
MAGLTAVLDTQVWLDWLVFDDPSIEPIRDAHVAGRLRIVIDEACEAELLRVLAYDFGKFTLEPAAQGACIARCRQLSTRVAGGNVSPLPQCRDPDDQKFLELAAGAGAQVLISKDQALLALAPRVAQFRILAPKDFAGL